MGIRVPLGASCSAPLSSGPPGGLEARKPGKIYSTTEGEVIPVAKTPKQPAKGAAKPAGKPNPFAGKGGKGTPPKAMPKGGKKC